MEKRGRGRPPKVENKELLTLDEAVAFIREQIRAKYGVTDEATLDRVSYKKRTLYNMISANKLHRYGPRHCALVDKQEIKLLCG